MKARFVAVLAILASGASTSQAITYSLSGPMDVFQATSNPDNVGDGTGTIAGDYDDLTNTLNYTITWMDLTSEVTNMHFHLGAPGVPGGVEVGIPGPWSSPQTGTDVILSDEHEANLLAGDWYVNVHTEQFGGGEIRGQVLVSPIPEPATGCIAAVALLCLAPLVRRKR